LTARGSVGGVAALAEGFVEDDGTGGGDVEGTDAAGHGDAEQVVAGLADQVVEACAFAAENEDAVAGEVELVVVGRAALVETDDPDVLFLEVLEGADEVDDAGDAEMLGGPGAGFYGDWTQGGGTAFSEDDAIYASAVGYAEQGTEVLRVFHAVEGEQQAAGAGLVAWGEEVFDGKELLRADQGYYALMGGGFGHLGQLLAGVLANADAGLATGGDEAVKAQILTLLQALAGYNHLVEAAAAGLEGFFNRVHAVENFHEG
jgi:hypothetical protein